MALKILMVALTTVREVDGETKRVRFPAKAKVELTGEELALLDQLQNNTGKLHYRDVDGERGEAHKPVTTPEVVKTPEYAGQSEPIGKKSIVQLKSYLTHFGVEFPSNASKKALLDLATAHAGSETGEPEKSDDFDLDRGL